MAKATAGTYSSINKISFTLLLCLAVIAGTFFYSTLLEITSYVNSFFYVENCGISQVSAPVSLIRERNVTSFSIKIVPAQRFLRHHLIPITIREVSFSNGQKLVFSSNSYSRLLQPGRAYRLHSYCTGLYALDTRDSILEIRELQ